MVIMIYSYYYFYILFFNCIKSQTIYIYVCVYLTVFVFGIIYILSYQLLIIYVRPLQRSWWIQMLHGSITLNTVYFHRVQNLRQYSYPLRHMEMKLIAHPWSPLTWSLPPRTHNNIIFGTVPSSIS